MSIERPGLETKELVERWKSISHTTNCIRGQPGVLDRCDCGFAGRLSIALTKAIAALEVSERQRPIREPTEAEYELYCDGMFAAGTSGPAKQAWREIMLYYSQYQHEGSCVIYKITREKIVSEAE